MTWLGCGDGHLVRLEHTSTWSRPYSGYSRESSPMYSLLIPVTSAKMALPCGRIAICVIVSYLMGLS